MSARFRKLGLIFEKSSDGGASGIPHGPMARIYLQTWMTESLCGFSEKVHTLTPFEYGPDTFDAHADALIYNIQQLKKEARARFKRDRKRELKRLSVAS